MSAVWHILRRWRGEAAYRPAQAATAAAALSPLYCLVPDGLPIRIDAYYPQFSDIYPDAELQTKRWLMRNARPDWVALDIGAHIGVYSIVLSRLLTNGTVHSFEPTETVRMLRENLAAHGCANVAVHEVALGARSGDIDEPIYRIWGAEPDRRSYHFSTVDDFVRSAGLTRLDFVKIDVDGFDLNVLEGAAETLARHDPWVVVELNHALATRGRSVGEALRWLIDQGYTEALVLDTENFLLRRAASATGASQDGMRLRFDREPVVVQPAFVSGARIDDFFAAEPRVHGTATWEDGVVLAPGPRWTYAISWTPRDHSIQGPVVIDVALSVTAGGIGLGCVNPAMTEYVGKEMLLAPGDEEQLVRLFIAQAENIGHLVLRNVDLHGAPSQAAVRAIRVGHAVPGPVGRGQDRAA